MGITMRQVWAAGFFDGEGHIHKTDMYVAVKQVDPDPLRRLWQWFGGSVRNYGERHLRTVQSTER